MRILPPLPVQQVANHEVYENPFYEPVKRPIQNDKFHLASGSGRPAIRLKSIDAAIGLQPISGAPESVRPPAIRVEPQVPSSIQSNPLIRSEHHRNSELVNTQLAQPSDRRGNNSAELHWQRPAVAMPPAVRISRDAPISAPQPDQPIEDIETQPLIQQVATNEIDELLRRAEGVADQANDTAQKIASPIAEALASPTLPMLPAVPQPMAMDTQSQVGTIAAPIVESMLPSVDSSQAVVEHDAVMASPAAQLYAPQVRVAAPAPGITEADIAVAQPVSIPTTVAAPDATGAELIPPVEPEPVVSAPAANPVFFSMSDSSGEDAALSPSDMFEEQPLEPTDTDQPSEVVVDQNHTSPQPMSILVRPGSEGDEPVVAVAEPLGLQPVHQEPANDSADSLRNIDGQNPLMVDSPVVASPVTNSSDTRKRFRPPVAVVAPPLAIERDTGATSSELASSDLAAPVRSATQNPVVAARPIRTAKAAPKNSPTKLHMTRAQVRSLTIGGHVRRITVANENVCQAIATGPNQLKLIGTGNGVTRLVVWADTARNSATRVRTFEIHVEDAVDNAGRSVGNKSDALNDSIVRAFPNANVSVQQYQNRLIVSGDCETEETAKKIIRMVRKTCLVPVRDEIKVR